MTREEAINEIKSWDFLEGKEIEAIQTLIPELKESEEERIRKSILHKMKACQKQSNFFSKEEIAYLEKQKENANSFADGVIEVRSFQRGMEEGRRLEKQKEQRDYRKLYKDIAKSKWFKQNYVGKSLGCDEEQKPAEVDESTKRLNENWMKQYFDEQESVDYEAELKKCKDNPLYFYDKYVSIKQKPVEYLSKDKVYAIMSKLTKLSTSNLIPFNSPEYKKINEITSDVRSLLDYPIEQKPILEVFGFKVGDAVRLKDGDGRKHIIKSFEEVEGLHGPNFYHVEFEDNSARDSIYPGEEYPNGYYTQMEKFEEEQKPVVTHGETYHVDTLGTQQVIAGKMPQKPVERSLEDDHIIGFVYDLLNEIEWKDDWAMSKDECLRLLSNYIPQKPANNISKEEYVKRFKVLCDAYEIKLPNREYDIYHLCDDLSKLSIDPGKQKPAEWNPNYEDVILFNKAVTTNQNLTPSERAKLDIIRTKFKHCNGHIATSDFDLALGERYIQGYNDALEELKPAEWSEEDEEMLNSCISSIEESKENRYAYKENDGDTSYDREIAWLKSLPERFNLQSKQEQNDYITPHKEFFKFIYDRLINVHKENPNVDYMRSFKERLNNLSFGEKQKWSEEDEDRYNSTIEVLQIAEANNGYNHYGRQEIIKDINWLKSLRPSWKPSGEQMESLRDTIINTKGYSYSVYLPELYEQLKKLM